MANVLAVVEFKSVSGKPEDKFVNNWAFTTPSAGIVTADLDNIFASLGRFYNTVVGSTARSVSNFMSSAITRVTGQHQVKFYDLTGHLDGSDHGSPVQVNLLDINANTAGTKNLPSEMCVCLSYKAAYAGDAEFAPGSRPRARDRGRIYIGPLNDGFVTNDVNNRPLVGTAMRDTLGTSANALVAEAGNAWSVWSRKAATMEPVIGGWVDDALDVQRRRGERATTRTLWGTSG